MARCPAHGNRIQLNPSRAVNLFGATPQPDCRRTAGILHVESADPGHDPKGRIPLGHRPEVERGPGQPQERTLATDAELWVVVIDQLSQFTGIRAAETFF